MDIIEVIKSGDYLVLDCETTGLDSTSEICQIAIIDSSANVLLDTLVKPVHPIPAQATAIHGITDEMVKDAPRFPVREIFDLLDERNVIIYNASYDVSMLYRAERAIDNPLDVNWHKVFTSYCAMETFAEIYGDYNEYRNSYRWQKLSTACAYYKIKSVDAHNALADCLMTLEVCKMMAVKEQLIEDAKKP